MSNVENLTDEQRKAYDAIREGKNVFLTGKAGTGKSYVIDAVLDGLGPDDRVVVAAPTGTAALNIRYGSTIHRAFKLKVEDVYDPQEEGNPCKEITNADIIIIDEISMVRLDLFDRIANIVKRATRMSGKRKQLVVVGDFFQLSPVMKPADKVALAKFYPNVGEGHCFNAFNWKYFNFECHLLDTIIRQDGDKEFIDNLNLARFADPACCDYFNQHIEYNCDDIDVLRMVGTNAVAKKINIESLNVIDEPEHTFRAEVEGKVNVGDRPVDDVIVLKVGCRVMSVVNDRDDRFQNGSLGTVSSFTSDGKVEVVFDNGYVAEISRVNFEITRPKVIEDDKTGKISIKHDVIGSFRQIPLKLAYAITIHKSQGKTLDSCLIDPNSFAAGQLYVALSRCKSFDGLRLMRAIKPGYLISSQDVIDFYNKIADAANRDVWGELEESVRCAKMIYGESAYPRVRQIVADEFAIDDMPDMQLSFESATTSPNFDANTFLEAADNIKRYVAQVVPQTDLSHLGTKMSLAENLIQAINELSAIAAPNSSVSTQNQQTLSSATVG